MYYLPKQASLPEYTIHAITMRAGRPIYRNHQTNPDTDINNPAEVYHAIASRCDPARDIVIVDNTRGSPYDPSASPIDGLWRTVGKIGIDATRKGRHHAADFDRSWPIN